MSNEMTTAVALGRLHAELLAEQIPADLARCLVQQYAAEDVQNGFCVKEDQ